MNRIFFIFLAMLSFQVHAGLYQCTSSDGSVTFQDFPCEESQTEEEKVTGTHSLSRFSYAECAAGVYLPDRDSEYSALDQAYYNTQNFSEQSILRKEMTELNNISLYTSFSSEDHVFRCTQLAVMTDPSVPVRDKLFAYYALQNFYKIYKKSHPDLANEKRLKLQPE